MKHVANCYTQLLLIMWLMRKEKAFCENAGSCLMQLKIEYCIRLLFLTVKT